MRYVEQRLLEIRTGAQPAPVTRKPLQSVSGLELKRYRQRIAQSAWRKTPKGRARMQQSNLKHTHGITLEQYDRLWDACRGRCCICADPLVRAYTAESIGKKGPQRGSAHIDHDHACCPGRTSCGRCIRGLLCARCNHGLASFRDRPQLLMAASGYLATRGLASATLAQRMDSELESESI